MFRSELASFLGAAANPTQFQGLQIPAFPIEVLWDQPQWGKWLSFRDADNIPLWGPVFQDSPANRVVDAYGLFLTSIDAPAQDPAAAQEAADLGVRLADAAEGISNARSRLGRAWRRFDRDQADLPEEFQLSFEQWFAQDWGQRLAVLQNNYDNIAVQWVSAANRAGGGWQQLAQAVLAYNNPAFQVQLENLDGAKLAYRTWSLVPPLEDFIAEAKANQGTSLTIAINRSTSTTDITSSSWDVSTGLSIGIFGLSASGGHERTTVDATSQDFQMTFSTKAFTGIRIAPGGWFNQNVVLQFQNGPFIPTSIVGQGRARFFGPPDGVPVLFNLVRTVVYVAWQPQVSCKLDQTAFTSVHDSWNAGGGLSIGPFSFGGGISGSSDTAQFDATNRTFTITSASPHPQIVAVRSTVMPG